MHVHVGALKTVMTFLDVIIVGFFWRLIAFMNSQSAIGQAMAFVY